MIVHLYLLFLPHPTSNCLCVLGHNFLGKAERKCRTFCSLIALPGVSMLGFDDKLFASLYLRKRSITITTKHHKDTKKILTNRGVPTRYYNQHVLLLWFLNGDQTFYYCSSTVFHHRREPTDEPLPTSAVASSSEGGSPVYHLLSLDLILPIGAIDVAGREGGGRRGLEPLYCMNISPPY